jgi:heptosyltransferase-1
MLGGPVDRGAAGRIRASGGPRLIDLAGETSLLQAAALIDRSALLVGVDTGLSHLGIAYGRPSLLLFGSTCPYLDTSRANARVLYHPLPCSPCRRTPTCNGEFTCMQSIAVNEV